MTLVLSNVLQFSVTNVPLAAIPYSRLCSGEGNEPQEHTLPATSLSKQESSDPFHR